MNSLRNALGRNQIAIKPRLTNRVKGPNSTPAWSLDAQNTLSRVYGSLSRIEGAVNDELMAGIVEDCLGQYRDEQELLKSLQRVSEEVKALICGSEYSNGSVPFMSEYSNSSIDMEVLKKFSDMILKRTKLRKGDLAEFDKIQAEFKKQGRPAIATAEKQPARPKDESAPKSQSKKSGSSGQKLTRLLSNSNREPPNIVPNRNNDMTVGPETAENSLTFTSVVSQSMTIRPRRDQNAKNSLGYMPGLEEENYARKTDGLVPDKDEAFIFYRPKKGPCLYNKPSLE